MWVIKYFLLALSAILYVLAFVEPRYFWWTVFIFTVPLLYAVCHYRTSFKEGYFWGVLVFGLHLHGVLIGIVQMAEGPWYARLVPASFIILYQAFFAAIAFWIAHILCLQSFVQKYCRCIKENIHVTIHHCTDRAKGIIWTVALLAFSYHLNNFCLLLFDYCEGYVFMNPLIPLAQYPIFLKALMIDPARWFGFSGISPFFIHPIIINSFLFFAIRQRAKKALLCFIIVFSSIFFLHAIQEKTIEKPAAYNHIKPLQLIFWSSPNISSMANAGRARFIELLRKWPDTEIIIMPEAAFYCSHLEQEEISAYWNEENLGKPMHIILGSFRWAQDNYRNSFLWFYNGVIQASFDKKHAMLLTERTPTLFNRATIHDLYFQRSPEIIPSNNERPLLHITPDIDFVPYICSELFFNQYADDKHPDTTILAICNDNWAPEYVGQLMKLCAIFKAVQWHRNILYISYAYTIYINTEGQSIDIMA